MTKETADLPSSPIAAHAEVMEESRNARILFLNKRSPGPVIDGIDLHVRVLFE
jgi:hypothetical protein